MMDSSADHASLDHDSAGGHATPRPFARLKLLLEPERRDIAAVAVYALAVAVLSLATPIAVESLVNTVAFGILMWPVVVISGVLMTCLGLAAAIRAMQVYVVECLQRRLFVRVVADYAHRFPRLQLEALDHHYGPELANRFFDVMTLQKSLAVLLLDGVAIVVTAGVGAIVLAFYHPFLLGFDVLLLLLVAFLLFVLGWGGVRTSIDESHAKYDVAAWLEELLRCLRTFKFFEGRRVAVAKADRLAGEYVAARRRHFRVVWRQTVFAHGLQVVTSTALLGLGGYLVINRQLTLGQLVAAELIVTLVVASIAKLGKYTENYYDLMASAEKLGMLTDIPLERAGGEDLPDSDRGIALRMNAAQFDWRIEPNEKVAITGPPGSGKTTLFEVLCGLRAPTHAVVEVDGIDLRGLSLDRYRERIAYVGGADIFLGTVLENVRVGRDQLTPGDVRTALESVGLMEAIHGLPQGLNTPLFPSGSPLSGSQGLRLTLARALVGKPRLLILDGVLDAMDLHECPELPARLLARTSPWTLLVTSTNPAILRQCDRIVELVQPDPPNEAVPASIGGATP